MCTSCSHVHIMLTCATSLLLWVLTVLVGEEWMIFGLPVGRCPPRRDASTAFLVQIPQQ